jgi:hypothetical protein
MPRANQVAQFEAALPVLPKQGYRRAFPCRGPSPKPIIKYGHGRRDSILDFTSIKHPGTKP